MDDINELMLTTFPGVMKEFLSADSVKGNNEGWSRGIVVPSGVSQLD